ncbi:MAG: bifunctional DNA-binding transcriptional regulator/O6-methylguanine-DNA methyltransferase Ada [Rubritepida sp.]|nr:bifunctional DNA-binding transcriptional regulator/O6-methylguanine-DNA methyltransferase Ada [Rubritepida sp.]
MANLESSRTVTRKMPAPSPNDALARDIAYTIGASELGQVLVARSADGICAILIDADPDTLKADLAERFSGQVSGSDDIRLKDDLAQVVRAIAAPRESLDLKLDLRGTPFQRRVWAALRAIPAGETVTYSELARRIGVPSAVRAVASACASNAIALAVPCHRVIRSDGSLSGYRWGVERKRTLIAKEALS